jgi:P pilus assembly chaperone PapD
MLRNCSQAPFTFTLRIQNDAKTSQNEFKITPQFAEISSKEERTIEIQFIPP